MIMMKNRHLLRLRRNVVVFAILGVFCMIFLHKIHSFYVCRRVDFTVFLISLRSIMCSWRSLLYSCVTCLEERKVDFAQAGLKSLFHFCSVGSFIDNEFKAIVDIPYA